MGLKIAMPHAQFFGETSEPIVLARSSQKNTQRVAKPLEAGEKGKKVSALVSLLVAWLVSSHRSVVLLVVVSVL